jgi:hypothetical protein
MSLFKSYLSSSDVRFFLNINCFTTYMLLSFKCLVSRLYVIISMTFENEVSLDTGK